MYQARMENRFEGLNEAQLYARRPAGNSTRLDRMLAEAQCGRRKPRGVLGTVGGEPLFVYDRGRFLGSLDPIELSADRSDVHISRFLASPSLGSEQRNIWPKSG
jgi:hypothetical protein